MTSPVDLYFSFRSPYSYLAAQSVRDLPARFDVTLHLRPVLPLAIRDPDFFRPENVRRARYILVDWERRAEMLGLPHVWPSPDPIVQDLSTFTIAEEQPYIHRLSRLGVEAEHRGRGIDFAAEVSRLIFGGTHDWHTGGHLETAADRADLVLAAMESAIGDGAAHDAVIAANQEALEVAGHWGVPTFVFEGEPFFGQDRIDSLCWRLGQQGLERAPR